MITKKTSELKKGDVIRCEFGDYGNIVTVVVESVKPCTDGFFMQIVGHYASNEKHVEMYGHKDDLNEIISERETA